MADEALHAESRSSSKETHPERREREKKKASRERERVCVRGEEGRGEEVGSGPLLLPWRPHPDAAAAVRASGRSESVCG